MAALLYVAAALGALLAGLLVILLMRGRFGTPSEQGEYELNELAGSADVPRKALRKEAAVCRGRSDRPIIGAGVLWLTGDELGFLLRTPRRRITLPLASVERVEVTDRYVRPGLVETSDAVDLLVVSFRSTESSGSLETVCWHLDDADAWAASIDDARSALST